MLASEDASTEPGETGLLEASSSAEVRDSELSTEPAIVLASRQNGLR